MNGSRLGSIGVIAPSAAQSVSPLQATPALPLQATPGVSPAGVDDLAQRLYGELRTMAARVLRHERRDHTLQPTALVNEAYLRLLDQAPAAAGSRERFLVVAAHVMRQVLVDHARRRNAQKRLGARTRVALDDDVLASGPGPLSALDALVVDEALTRLAAIDARRAEVVCCRVFGGLAREEVADALGISRSTAAADWQAARAWLSRELRRGGER